METPQERAERIANGAAPPVAPVQTAETPQQRAQRIANDAPAVTVRPASGPRLSRPEVSQGFANWQSAARAKGYEIELRSGDRDEAQQSAIWNKAAPVPGKSYRMQASGLPVAAPGHSRHNKGEAVDVRVYRNGRRVNPAEVAALATEHGFHHLGAHDPPHFNYVGASPKDLGDTRRRLAAKLHPANETPEQRALRIASAEQATPTETVRGVRERATAPRAPAAPPAKPAAPPPRPLNIDRFLPQTPAVDATGLPDFVRPNAGVLGKIKPGSVVLPHDPKPATAAKKRGEVYGPQPPNAPRPGARPGEMRLPDEQYLAKTKGQREAPSPIGAAIGDVVLNRARVTVKPGQVAKSRTEAANVAGKVAEVPFAMVLPNMHRVLSQEPEKINDGTALEQAFVKDFAVLRAGNQAEKLTAAIPALQKITAGLQGAAKTKFTQALARVFSPAQMAANFAGGVAGQVVLDAPEKLTAQERLQRAGEGGLASTAFGAGLRGFSKNADIRPDGPNDPGDGVFLGPRAKAEAGQAAAGLANARRLNQTKAAPTAPGAQPVRVQVTAADGTILEGVRAGKANGKVTVQTDNGMRVTVPEAQVATIQPKQRPKPANETPEARADRIAAEIAPEAPKPARPRLDPDALEAEARRRLASMQPETEAPSVVREAAPAPAGEPLPTKAGGESPVSALQQEIAKLRNRLETFDAETQRSVGDGPAAQGGQRGGLPGTRRARKERVFTSEEAGGGAGEWAFRYTDKGPQFRLKGGTELSPEDTDDLLHAGLHFSDSRWADEEALTQWGADAGVDRIRRAFDIFEKNPEAKDAVEAFFKRMDDDEAAAVAKELAKSHGKPKDVLGRVRHEGMSTPEGHRRFSLIDEADPEAAGAKGGFTRAQVDELYAHLNTPGRSERMYQTATGKHSLKAMLYDLQTVPNDAFAMDAAGPASVRAGERRRQAPQVTYDGKSFSRPVKAGDLVTDGKSDFAVTSVKGGVVTARHASRGTTKTFDLTGDKPATLRHLGKEKADTAPAASKAAAPKPTETREPWQMRRGEFADRKGTVHHGTNADDFADFDTTKQGSATDEGWLGAGHYFSTDREVARGNKTHIPADVQLKNPLRIEADFKTDKRKVVNEAIGTSGLKGEALTKALRDKGYDGVILDYSPAGYGLEEVVAFEPGQITTHRAAVKKALAEGKPVPAEVLADYPDLTPKPKGDDLTLTSPSAPTPRAPKAEAPKAATLAVDEGQTTLSQAVRNAVRNVEKGATLAEIADKVKKQGHDRNAIAKELQRLEAAGELRSELRNGSRVYTPGTKAIAAPAKDLRMAGEPTGQTTLPAETDAFAAKVAADVRKNNSIWSDTRIRDEFGKGRGPGGVKPADVAAIRAKTAELLADAPDLAKAFAPKKPRATDRARATADALEAKGRKTLAALPPTLPGKGKGRSSGAVLPPEAVQAYAEIAVAKAVRSGANAADAVADLAREFPTLAREHLDAIAARAKAMWDEYHAAGDVDRPWAEAPKSPRSETPPAEARAEAPKPAGGRPDATAAVESDPRKAVGLANQVRDRAVEAGVITRKGKMGTRRTPEELQAAGDKLHNEGLRGDNLVRELRERTLDNKPLNDVEVMAVLKDHQVRVNDLLAKEKAAEAAEAAGGVKFRQLSEEAAAARRAVDELEEAWAPHNTEFYRQGLARQMGKYVDDGDAANVILRSRRSNGQKAAEISKETEKLLTDAANDVKTAREQLEKAQRDLQELRAKGVVKEGPVRTRATGTKQATRTKRTIAEIKAENEDLVKQFNSLWAEVKPPVRVTMGGLPQMEAEEARKFFAATPELAKIVGKLGRNAVEMGAVTMKDIVTHVRTTLGQPNLHHDDIREAFLNEVAPPRDPKEPQTLTELEQALQQVTAEAKKERRLLEQIEGGAARKPAAKVEMSTERGRELEARAGAASKARARIRAKEAYEASRPQREQSTLDRLEAKKAEYERRIKERDYSPLPTPEVRQASEKVKAAQAEVAKKAAVVRRLIETQGEMTGAEKVHAYVAGGLTSGPGTHFRNVLSTALMTAQQTPREALTALQSQAMAKIHGTVPEQTLGDVTQGFVATWQAGVPKGLKDFMEAMREGQTADQASRLELPMEEFKPQTWLPHDLVKRGINANRRLLTAEDAFFRAVISETAKATEAARLARLEGVKGHLLKRRIEELMDSKKVRDFAEEQAKRFTYNDDPDKVLNAILIGRGNLPPALRAASTFILPFIRVPYNVLKRSVEYSPVGLLRLSEAADLKLKIRELPTLEKQRIMSEAALGTIAGATAFGIAQKLEITGEAPKDEGARDAFYRTGRKPYSVKLGDRWVSYASTPYTNLFAMAARMQDSFGDKKPLTMTDKAARMATGLMSDFTQQSFLTGLNTLFMGMADPGRGGEKLSASILRMLIPLSGMTSSIARATDPNERKPDGAIQQAQQHIPGLRQMLPIRQSAFGEDQKQDPSGLGAMQPVIGERAKDTPVEKELRRLRYFPGAPSVDFSAGKGKPPITLKGKEERDYLQKAGATMLKAVEDEMKKPTYQAADDTERKQMIESAVSRARRNARQQFGPKPPATDLLRGLLALPPASP